MRAWDNFLKTQEKQLGVKTVDRWLRTLRVIDFDACNLYLEAKDTFQVMWFEEHIREKVMSSLVNNNNKSITIHLNTPQGTSTKKAHTSKKKPPPPPEFTIAFDELNPFCTFNNFISSDANLLAYKLLCKITNYDPISETIIPSENELAAFNPIYLFGGEGSGKTHLLHATAHALESQDLKVVCIRAETFTEHVVTAIRAGEMSTFRNAYRNIDILLIDDVHVFSRKGATQEELFHTFNTLHLAGKQIILSANCSPQELQYIEPRLVSRFEWGIVLPLDPLPQKDLQKVLIKKAEALDCVLHPKVRDFLLSTFQNSTKTLTRAFEALILRHYLKLEKEKRPSSPITVQVAKHLLHDLIEEEEKAALTPQKILRIVSEYFGIRQEDILSKTQTRDCVLPRHLAMYICRTKLKTPYIKIGDIFSRDHSTVMSSVKLVKKGMDSDDKEIIGAYNCILKQLTK